MSNFKAIVGRSLYGGIKLPGWFIEKYEDDLIISEGNITSKKDRPIWSQLIIDYHLALCQILCDEPTFNQMPMAHLVEIEDEECNILKWRLTSNLLHSVKLINDESI
jgi:hypothetical protein